MESKITVLTILFSLTAITACDDSGSRECRAPKYSAEGSRCDIKSLPVSDCCEPVERCVDPTGKPCDPVCAESTGKPCEDARALAGEPGSWICCDGVAP